MKCWICGKEATKTLHGSWMHGKPSKGEMGVTVTIKPSKYYRSYCDECYDKVRAQEKQDEAEYLRLKKMRMFKKACDILESQHTDMYKYREAIDVVEEHISENPDKYDSSYEVLAAIVLIHNRIRCKTQYKVGRYQVDFLLPDWFVVLEIDGERHKYHKQRDSERDLKIVKTLGLHWEVIRINTELLDQNAKALPKAITKVLEAREIHKSK